MANAPRTAWVEVTLGIFSAALGACSASGTQDLDIGSEARAPAAGGSAGASGAAGSTGATGAGATGGGLFGSGGSLGIGGAAAGGGSGGVGMACEAVSETAENQLQPADIVIAIDQSGSMSKEIQWTQEQINGFSQQIVDSGIDVHIVIIVEKPGGPVGEHPLCVPPPLAAPNCESRPPTFVHVNQHVDSHDALEQILDTYDEYSFVLRPEATKHVVVISDDEPERVLGDDFNAGITSKDAALWSDYTFHAIVPFSDCSYASGPGDEYLDLVSMTGGVAGDLCQQDFQVVWDRLAEQVAQNALLSCEWQIPPPPAGQELNADAVNVRYTSTSGQAELGRVNSPSECGQYQNGWYYDNPANPTRVLVCPDVCANIQAGQGLQMDIEFGCKTRPPTPR